MYKCFYNIVLLSFPYVCLLSFGFFCGIGRFCQYWNSNFPPHSLCRTANSKIHDLWLAKVSRHIGFRKLVKSSFLLYRLKGYRGILSNDTKEILPTPALIWLTQWQTPAVVNPVQPSVAFMAKRYTVTWTLSDRVTWPKVQTQRGIKEKGAACSSFDNACMWERLLLCVHGMSQRSHSMSLHLCVSVFLWDHEEGWSPPLTSPSPRLCLPHDQSHCHATASFDALAQ